MSLRARELDLIAAELNRELGGAVVQKIHAPTTTRVYLEVRVPGRSVTLLVCSDPGAARLSAVEERPANPPQPPTWQHVLRRDLVGAKLIDAEAVAARRTLLLHLAHGDGKQLTLVLELGNAPGIALLTREGRMLAMSIPFRAGFRLGATWTPLDEAPVKDAPSRLASDWAVLRLCHGAEALFGEVEKTRWVDARRAPLLAKLKKLERTREKVRADAERTHKAAEYRREGELLAQNLHRVVRGEPRVTLTEYLEDASTREVTIALDPKRTPKQEVDWRFHQYKRLLRGAEMAKQRLATLELEERTLRDQLATLEAGTPELPPPAARKARDDSNAPLPPYREYVGARGQRIWVGRGSAHNDELTFHVAKPHHTWFHARGVPGAHVVVPLEKNAQLDGEVMLDAAHLALHHSDLKGEPRGEVSYTQVKFVRKAGAPGAVTFTREKTVLLRVEPVRLQRLLASAEQ